MNKNGIVIFHDTAFHVTNAPGITSRVAINTLKGKYIHLWTGYMKGLANIGALVLDDITQDMIWALFTNISLPWAYKITEEDFIDLYKHYSKFYAPEMLGVYIYCCVFYMNGGHSNNDEALKAAETSLRHWQKHYKPA